MSEYQRYIDERNAEWKAHQDPVWEEPSRELDLSRFGDEFLDVMTMLPNLAFHALAEKRRRNEQERI